MRFAWKWTKGFATWQLIICNFLTFSRDVTRYVSKNLLWRGHPRPRRPLIGWRHPERLQARARLLNSLPPHHPRPARSARTSLLPNGQVVSRLQPAFEHLRHGGLGVVGDAGTDHHRLNAAVSAQLPDYGHVE